MGDKADKMTGLLLFFDKLIFCISPLLLLYASFAPESIDKTIIYIVCLVLSIIVTIFLLATNVVSESLNFLLATEQYAKTSAIVHRMIFPKNVRHQHDAYRIN